MLSRKEQTRVHELDNALAKLPSCRGQLIRVVEHGNETPPPRGKKIQVGDVVTNYPCFMSASSTTDYASVALEGTLGRADTDTIAIYIITCPPDVASAVPLVDGILSQAQENEYLFPRHACFRVKGISSAMPDKPSPESLNRICVMLEQVPPRFRQ